ncbi:hypothetical protein BH10ACT3_BH10ACT3_15920 [soil metagenome]
MSCSIWLTVPNSSEITSGGPNDISTNRVNGGTYGLDSFAHSSFVLPTV